MVVVSFWLVYGFCWVLYVLVLRIVGLLVCFLCFGCDMCWVFFVCCVVYWCFFGVLICCILLVVCGLVCWLVWIIWLCVDWDWLVDGVNLLLGLGCKVVSVLWDRMIVVFFSVFLWYWVFLCSCSWVGWWGLWWV